MTARSPKRTPRARPARLRLTQNIARIDHVALGPGGAVAWSAGKTAFAQGKELRELEAPSTVGGLAFAPKGFRLAVAHYNGATLWFPNAAKRKPRSWNGKARTSARPSALMAAFCYDHAGADVARLAPHRRQAHAHVGLRHAGDIARLDGGWRLARHFRRSATHPVALPGQGRPHGQEPRLLAPSDHRITVVAAHPGQAIVAVGFDHGMVLLVRVADGAEILARKPGDGL